MLLLSADEASAKTGERQRARDSYRADMSHYRRLATLLATDPAHATADDVRRLLNNPGAAEGQDLDHKLEPHVNGTEG
ncbi:hypothetical protein [Streptomyces geranii]|uniref:hypothetical protein n=1 Tax=Streptomyces geranii TaxID=2058923 RepID=UPI00130036DC|nr:hypothetical protein [Streptomyces geranii]